MELNDSQIEAFCTLLDEESPDVAEALENQVSSFSDTDRWRVLERLRRGGKTPYFLPRSLLLLHFMELERRFTEWGGGESESLDLEEGALLIASFGAPLQEVRRCSFALDTMAQAIEGAVRSVSSPEEKLGKLADYLHRELGLDGDRENYYNPENSYLHSVIERRRGIPITLSAIYILMGRRLDLPIQGVGMPGHFVVKYDAPDGPIFLNPYERGRVMTVADCAATVRALGYHFDTRFLSETPARLIVERMLNNLIGIFQREGDEMRARQLARYREVIHAG
ncbi:MAG: transglutaminase-like domain-containing protein [bacterium]|nr:transglutaminase-like domain-containing protein [bacterium]